MEGSATPSALAAAATRQFTSLNTYEAKQPGDMARTIEVLHPPNGNPNLKHSLRHLTFRSDYDSLENCDLPEMLGIDVRNVGSVDDINATILEDDSISDLDFAALGLRRLLCIRQTHGDVSAFDLATVYAELFKGCAIQTVALSEAWLHGIADDDKDAWFKQYFPGVISFLHFEYKLNGEQYILFGSRIWTGNRMRDGQGLAHYSASETGDLARFISQIHMVGPDSPFVQGITHLAFDLDLDSVSGSGLMELFGIDPETLESDREIYHLLSTASTPLSRASANLRLLLSRYGEPGDIQTKDWLEFVAETLAVCANVRTIDLPRKWLAFRDVMTDMFLLVRGNVVTYGPDGKSVLLGLVTDLPEGFVRD